MLFLSKRLPHHEVSSHARLEDSIEGALGVCAIVKGEHRFNIVQATLVISCAHYLNRHLGVILGRSIALSTRRIKDILAQLDRCVELSWIARMGYLGFHTFSLKDKVKHVCCKYERKVQNMISTIPGRISCCCS